VVYDPAKFKDGTKVRIANLAQLENFFHTWDGHHKLTRDQLQYSGQIAEIKESAMYHGRDCNLSTEGCIRNLARAIA
jgi:hypothetical protein